MKEFISSSNGCLLACFCLLSVTNNGKALAHEVAQLLAKSRRRRNLNVLVIIATTFTLLAATAALPLVHTCLALVLAAKWILEGACRGAAALLPELGLALILLSSPSRLPLRLCAPFLPPRLLLLEPLDLT